jgi:hypothetical protein
MSKFRQSGVQAQQMSSSSVGSASIESFRPAVTTASALHCEQIVCKSCTEMKVEVDAMSRAEQFLSAWLLERTDTRA